MIENYDEFSRWNVESSKIYTFWNFHIYSTMINICSSSGGAQAKGKTGWNSVYDQNEWFSEFHPPSNCNVLFSKFFFESHPVYDQTQGYGAVLFLLHR
jgi:hypothetical protein